jgi:hypothetical protein
MRLRSHADMAIGELSQAEKFYNNTVLIRENLNRSQHYGVGKGALYENKMQIHYLFKHLVTLGKGGKEKDIPPGDIHFLDEYQDIANNFNFLNDHIVNAVTKQLYMEKEMSDQMAA